MVSGFFTSPYDHERIFSGEASPMRMASNSSSWVTCLKRSSSAFMFSPCGGTFACSRPEGPMACVPTIAFEVDVNGEGADFLHQHVERFGHARLDLVLALDDVLVDLGASLRVVGLDGEHLLERVRGAVRFQRPHLH